MHFITLVWCKSYFSLLWAFCKRFKFDPLGFFTINMIKKPNHTIKSYKIREIFDSPVKPKIKMM